MSRLGVFLGNGAGAWIFPWLGVGVLLVFAGCGSPQGDAANATANAVLAMDHTFARRALREGAPAAFRELLADGAVILPATEQPMRGEEIDAWLRDLEDALEWQPQGSWGAASGELGVTHGRWTSRGIDDDGNPRVNHGNYLTVWQKNAQGEWRVLVDLRGDLAVSHHTRMSD